MPAVHLRLRLRQVQVERKNSAGGIFNRVPTFRAISLRRDCPQDFTARMREPKRDLLGCGNTSKQRTLPGSPNKRTNPWRHHSADDQKSNASKRFRRTDLSDVRLALHCPAAGFVKLASTYPGLLPRFDSTFSQPLSSSTTLSFVPLEILATTG